MNLRTHKSTTRQSPRNGGPCDPTPWRCGGQKRCVQVRGVQSGCRGMSLGEMLLSMAGIAIILGLLMSVTNSVRADNADQQTRQILRSLRLALDQYQQATGNYPPEPASVAIHYLQSLPDCEKHLRELRFRTNLEGFTTITDGYGRPIRYFQATHLSNQSQFQPDFVSPGPDGKLGDLTSSDPLQQQAISDNVYGRDVQIPAL